MDAMEPPRPIRTCIGCRRRREKAALVRLVLDGSGRVRWDEFQASPGRGAYICPTEECLRLAIKKKQFSRAFRRSVDLSPIETAEAPWED